MNSKDSDQNTKSNVKSGVGPLADPNDLHQAIRSACSRQIGVIDPNFLCQPLSVLEPKRPLCMRQDVSVGDAIHALREKGVGSLLLLDSSDKLCGIFTERDCLQRVVGKYDELKSEPISRVMTAEPVSQPPDITIAFALNLMVHGNFRHLPLVADDLSPLGIVSARDVMDYLVNSFVKDILDLELEESTLASV